MAWLIIISSVIVIWIASLFKILHGSYSPSKGAVLNDSTNSGSAKKRNVLLVVSYPDDESMLSAIFEQGRLIAETDIARLHLKIHSCKQAQRNKSRRPADLFECKIDLPLRICEMLGMLTTKNEEAYSGCPVMSLRQGLFKGDQSILWGEMMMRSWGVLKLSSAVGLIGAGQRTQRLLEYLEDQLVKAE